MIIGDKYGYIDKTGKLVIAAKFDWAEYFSEGVAAAMIFKEESGSHPPDQNSQLQP